MSGNLNLLKIRFKILAVIFALFVVDVSLLAFVIQILFDQWTFIKKNPISSASSTSNYVLSNMLRQLDQLSVYCLNTCKKICLNFPLCFWSTFLPAPSFPAAPLRSWLASSSFCLRLTAPGWLLPSHHALSLYAKSMFQFTWL